MEAKISDVFWSLTSFEDLKKYLRQGNDFCKDVSSIINERVKVEMTYMEGLAKLSVRAKKATGDTLGTMKNAWEGFANQCEQEAEVRKSLAGDLLEQIVKPFKAFVDAQAKTRKQAELNVEKAGKSLADKKSDEMKVNRHNKVEDRIIVLTENTIFKLNPSFKEMKAIHLSKVHGIALSPGSDQVIIIKVHGNDLVICLHNDKQENRVSELMGLLVYVCKRVFKKDIPVEINEKISCELGNKHKSLAINGIRGYDSPRFEFKGKDNVLVTCPA